MRFSLSAVRFEDADPLNQAIRTLSLRHRARAAEMLAPLGLHPGQEVLLLKLAEDGPCIQAQLGEALGVEAPTVTMMTRKLEQRGYVSRTPAPSDRRASVVTLSNRGEAVVMQVKEVWRSLAEETVRGIPDATLAELPALLNTMARNVDTRGPRGGSRTRTR